MKSGAKNFFITLNQVEKWDTLLTYINKLSPNYVVACKEKAPTTGHVHIHMYVQFPNSRRLSIAGCCGANIQKCKGSPEQNYTYITKCGDPIYEHGQMRKCHSTSIKEVKAMSKEERSDLNVNMFNIVKKINDEEAKDISPLEYYKKVDVFFVYGPSGIGKTKWCIDDMVANKIEKFNEVKFDGHFWNGVKEETTTCLYDDWRDSHMKPSEFINFIDYTKHIMNTKGGSIRNNYTRIYITSIQDPNLIYPQSREENTQWIRRIHCINLNPEEGSCRGYPPADGIGKCGGSQEGSVEASSK